MSQYATVNGTRNATRSKDFALIVVKFVGMATDDVDAAELRFHRTKNEAAAGGGGGGGPLAGRARPGSVVFDGRVLVLARRGVPLLGCSSAFDGHLGCRRCPTPATTATATETTATTTTTVAEKFQPGVANRFLANVDEEEDEEALERVEDAEEKVHCDDRTIDRQQTEEPSQTHNNGTACGSLYLKNHKGAFLLVALQSRRSVTGDAFDDDDEEDEVCQPDQSERKKEGKMEGSGGQPTVIVWSSELSMVNGCHKNYRD